MKLTIISIILAVIFIGGAVIFSRGGVGNDTVGSQDNIPITIDGKQIIEIIAKGGYSPNVSIAKANIPTVLKVKTRGTFDCSSALVIPSIGYRKNLPPSGEILIEVPPQEAGSTLQGMCSMGMYNFSVEFN